MPRTITVDNVRVVQIRLMQDAKGALRIYGEYALMSGSQIVKVKHIEVTRWVSSANQTAVGSILSQIGQAITAAETT